MSQLNCGDPSDFERTQFIQVATTDLPVLPREYRNQQRREKFHIAGDYFKVYSMHSRPARVYGPKSSSSKTLKSPWQCLIARSFNCSLTPFL